MRAGIGSCHPVAAGRLDAAVAQADRPGGARGCGRPGSPPAPIPGGPPAPPGDAIEQQRHAAASSSVSTGVDGTARQVEAVAPVRRRMRAQRDGGAVPPG